MVVEDSYNGLESNVVEDKSQATILISTIQQGSSLTGAFRLSFPGDFGMSTTPLLDPSISAEDLRLALQRLKGTCS